MALKINLDALGIATSVACAIHCALLPLFLSSLPLFGVNIIDNLYFEYFMVFLAFLVGIYALYHGRKKHHHRSLPMVIFTFGILLLLAKVIWHQWQLWLLFPAVATIVTAHYLNFRFCRVHNHGHAEDCNH
ncbi:MAG: MerC domain-containing protein [Chitinophagaceae bacterium]|nr:MerC domain-containing protein [Chitinophagaceae bacterium]